MSRRNRVRDPKGTPHPPGCDGPREKARRNFKQDVDHLVRSFLKDNDDLDWPAVYATAEGRKQLIEAFARHAAGRATRSPHMEP